MDLRAATQWPSILQVPTDPPVIAGRNEIPDWLFLGLLAVTGVCWAYAYACIIYRAGVDTWLGIPVFAVVLNLSWEITYVIVLPHPPQQKPFDLVWILLDLVILRLAFRYGWKDFDLPRAAFARLVAAALVLSFVLHVVMGWEFADDEGIYGAMVINLYMSLAFIRLLRRRGSSVGQTMHVAVAKAVGTFSAGVMFFAWYPGRNLLTLCALAVLAIDIVYIRLLADRLKADGVPIWSLRHPTVRGAELARS